MPFNHRRMATVSDRRRDTLGLVRPSGNYVTDKQILSERFLDEIS